MTDFPNILLVVLDSVRARNLSLYGYDRETSPFLDTLSDDATVFTRAIAPTVWSLPSHASFFTGYHVPEHGVTDQASRINPDETVFAELRDQYGYDTGLFTQNSFLTAMDTGLSDPFNHITSNQNDLFKKGMQPVEGIETAVIEGVDGPVSIREYVEHALEHDHTIKSLLNGVYAKLVGAFPRLSGIRPAPDPSFYTDAFERWVSKRSGSWAACINYMGAHGPYKPGDYNIWGDDELLDIQQRPKDMIWEFVSGVRPWWQRRALVDIYDGAIRNVDNELKRLYDILAKTGVRDETLVIVCGDHGEGFGENARLHPVRISGHAYSVTEPLVHVPLVIDLPNDHSQVNSQPASLTGIPDLVRATVEGNPTTEPITEMPVVTVAPGLSDIQKKKANEYISDQYPYEKSAKAVYEAGDDDAVVKHVTWADRSATIELYDEGGFRIDRNSCAAPVVDATFGDFKSVDVREEGSTDVDGTVEQRLKELGYR